MYTLRLAEFTGAGQVVGSRFRALPIRDQIEELLKSNDRVGLDFAETSPTQSFVDEVVGVLVLERGAAILKQLVFLNCDEDAKSILHFVVSDRLRGAQAKLNQEVVH